MMKTNLKLITITAFLALVCLVANAKSTAVDKVAELDDVYSYYMPSIMIKGLEKLGGQDILKGTPIPNSILKKIQSMQFIMASKKKTVNKAQKILKELDDSRLYQLLFRSSTNKEERINAYASPANSDIFDEVILVINEHDRQLIVLQFLGEFSMEDINDIEEELHDDNSPIDDEAI